MVEGVKNLAKLLREKNYLDDDLFDSDIEGGYFAWKMIEHIDKLFSEQHQQQKLIEERRKNQERYKKFYSSVHEEMKDREEKLLQAWEQFLLIKDRQYQKALKQIKEEYDKNL